MLRTIAPRVSASKRRGLGRCGGGLPLALRVAGGALAERETAGGDYLRTLRQPRIGSARAGAVESSLGHQRRLLGTPAPALVCPLHLSGYL